MLDIEEQLPTILKYISDGSLCAAREGIIYKMLMESPEMLKNPDALFYLMTYKIKKEVIAAIEDVKQPPKETAYKYTEAFYNGNEYNLIIQNFLQRHEGFQCSGDKAGFILSEYRASLCGKQTSDWDSSDPNTYWVPSTATKESWLKLADSIYGLRRGNIDDYQTACDQIISMKKKVK